MKLITFFLSASVIILASSCSPNHPKTSTEEIAHTETTLTATSEAATKEKHQGALTDAQEKTLEKAKAVEKGLYDSNEKRLKKIDEMTQ